MSKLSAPSKNLSSSAGRSIGQNLRITSKLVDKAAKAGTSILGGKK
jgi:hypothetical protein